MNIEIEAKTAKVYLKGIKNNKFNLAVATIVRIEQLSKTNTVIGKAMRKKKEQSFDN